MARRSTRKASATDAADRTGREEREIEQKRCGSERPSKGQSNSGWRALDPAIAERKAKQRAAAVIEVYPL